MDIGALEQIELTTKLPKKTDLRQSHYSSSMLENIGVKVILCAGKNNRVNLEDALRKLCETGVNSVLVEGGGNLATQFLSENLVDELVWIRNKKIIGDDGIPAISAMNFSKVSDALDSFARQEIREFNDDLVEIYVRLTLS